MPRSSPHPPRNPLNVFSRNLLSLLLRLLSSLSRSPRLLLVDFSPFLPFRFILLRSFVAIPETAPGLEASLGVLAFVVRAAVEGAEEQGCDCVVEPADGHVLRMTGEGLAVNGYVGK